MPDQAHEALRNLVRARADAKADELRAKHRLSKFLMASHPSAIPRCLAPDRTQADENRFERDGDSDLGFLGFVGTSS